MSIAWDDLRYLEVIDRLGGVKAAARSMGLSASTLYRRVAVLEAALGVVCLVRGQTGELLTEQGRQVALVGRRTQQAVTELESRLRARGSAVEGEVSVTTVDALRPYVVTAVKRVVEEHPNLRVVLHLGDDGPSVRNREVDIALSVVPSPPAGCWGRRLSKLASGVFGQPEVIARTPRVWVTRAEAERASPESLWERRHCDNVVARAPFSTLVSLVADGVGLGLMPRKLGVLYGLHEVVEYRASVVKLERSLWLLTHEELRTVPRVKAVMKALARAVMGDA